MSDSHILAFTWVNFGQFWDGTSTILTYLRAYLECHPSGGWISVALVDPKSRHQNYGKALEVWGLMLKIYDYHWFDEKNPCSPISWWGTRGSSDPYLDLTRHQGCADDDLELGQPHRGCGGSLCVRGALQEFSIAQPSEQFFSIPCLTCNWMILNGYLWRICLTVWLPLGEGLGFEVSSINIWWQWWRQLMNDRLCVFSPWVLL